MVKFIYLKDLKKTLDDVNELSKYKSLELWCAVNTMKPCFDIFKSKCVVKHVAELAAPFSLLAKAKKNKFKNLFSVNNLYEQNIYETKALWDLFKFYDNPNVMIIVTSYNSHDFDYLQIIQNVLQTIKDKSKASPLDDKLHVLVDCKNVTKDYSNKLTYYISNYLSSKNVVIHYVDKKDNEWLSSFAKTNGISTMVYKPYWNVYEKSALIHSNFNALCSIYGQANKGFIMFGYYDGKSETMFSNMVKNSNIPFRQFV